MKTAALSSFNNENNILLVSNYPEVEGNKVRNVSGIAHYSFHMLPPMLEKLQEEDRSVIVLAENLEDGKEIRKTKNLAVLRCWRRKHPLVFVDILKAILQFNKVKKIFIHFEFNMFAASFITGLFPLFLLVLKFLGKDTTILLHQVIFDLNDLSGHIGLKENSIKTKAFNLIIKYFYKCLLFSANKIIVHDQILKDRLKTISNKAVFVVPHGLGEHKNICDLIDARTKLAIPNSNFVVLSFGFIAWYKGSDWLVDQFAEYYDKTGDKSVKLILAGGKSPNLADMQHYRDYYDSVVNKAQEYPNILVTGYVPDDDIKYYYCAADVVVLPYRVQMSASGPFAIGLSFDRPFLLSEELSGVLETEDVKYGMAEFDIDKSDLLFKMKGKNFFKRVSELVNDKKSLTQLSELSAYLNEERQWENINRKFLYIIDA